MVRDAPFSQMGLDFLFARRLLIACTNSARPDLNPSLACRQRSCPGARELDLPTCRPRKSHLLPVRESDGVWTV